MDWGINLQYFSFSPSLSRNSSDNPYKKSSGEKAQYVGGIVGQLFSGSVKECTNTGSVEGRNSIGGITSGEVTWLLPHPLGNDSKDLIWGQGLEGNEQGIDDLWHNEISVIAFCNIHAK